MIEINKIYNEDCLQILKKMDEKSIDIIFTDPPYGVSYKKKGEPYLAGDGINLLPIVLPELFRVLKDDGAIYIWSSILW